MKHMPVTGFSASPAHPVDSIAAPIANGHCNTQPYMGLRLMNATPEDAASALLAPGHRRAAFLNAHCANVMKADPSYMEALRSADAVLPDGVGIELGVRMLGGQLTANLNGTDFVPVLAREASRRGLSIFFFGGTPGTAQAAANALWRKVPGLRIAGTRDGFEGAADTDAVIAEINASGADIVLVAMGVPKQDIWLADHAESLNARLTMGVGALFDFLAGNVRRAPAFVRTVRAEWVWRLAMEPRRMAKRYLAGNFSFLGRAIGHALTQGGFQRMGKRAIDLSLTGMALIVIGPILALVAMAIAAESRGPVFFRQTRIGQDGKPFTLLKFRSMHVDAEARRAALLADSDRQGVCFKSRHDPRVTRVGRIMRRFSIDELPQLLNILRGDMALVGPRPALPEEVAAYPMRARGRLAVKPGLTGLWQVSGRADIGFDKMIDMDLAYARSQSVLLDILLIALTFRAVVSGRGAY